MVLVTGGTGLVGSHLLLRLLRNGVPVRATYRNEHSLKRVEKIFSYYVVNVSELFQKIEWCKADLGDLPALEAAFAQVEKVYHTAALISFDPRDHKKLQRANREGTANLVNLCIAKKVQKLCYVSSTSAIGKSMDGPANEDSEWTEKDVSVYALSKYAAEMEVWRAGQEGVPVVIVNPGVIIGPGFWQQGSGRFFSTAQKGYSYYPPGGTGFVGIWDTVRAMVGLMDSAIQNERFILVSDNLRYGEILGLITEHLGRPKPTKELKIWQLQIGRFFDGLKSRFTGSARQITKNSVRTLKHRRVFSSDKIRRQLGLEFEPLEKVVSFCCEKFVEEHH